MRAELYAGCWLSLQMITNRGVNDLLHRLDRAGLDFVKTEGLYRFDGQPGYSLGQGQ